MSNNYNYEEKMKLSLPMPLTDPYVTPFVNIQYQM